MSEETEDAEVEAGYDEYVTMQREQMDEQRFIASGWEGFAKAVFPPDTPPMQIAAMREAFYAGADHMFEGTVCVIGQDESSEADDQRRLDGINDELEAHHLSVCPTCAAKNARTKH